MVPLVRQIIQCFYGKIFKKPFLANRLAQKHRNDRFRMLRGYCSKRLVIYDLAQQSECLLTVITAQIVDLSHHLMAKSRQ